MKVVRLKVKRTPVLQYEGSVREFRRALRKNRMAITNAGTVVADQANRRYFQDRLRQAQLRSLRRQILGRDGIA